MLMRLDLPPVWLVLFMALAWTASPESGGDSLLWPGRVLIALGLALAIWAALAFKAASTTIVPKERPEALVETGPYRYSRNPIYLADLVILAGWCLTLDQPLALALLLPFWWVLQTRFILPEEQILEEDLGAPYIAYKARIRRWI